MHECQYIGPEQTDHPFTMCGCRALAGKSYCGDHYWIVYKKGSASAGRRNEKAIDAEIADFKRQQEVEEIMEMNDV
jgi:hypothetical protein